MEVLQIAESFGHQKMHRLMRNKLKSGITIGLQRVTKRSITANLSPFITAAANKTVKAKEAERALHITKLGSAD